MRLKESTVATTGLGVSVGDLYRSHASRAWQAAFSVTKNRDDAADAVAEAFASLVEAERGGRLRQVDDLGAYLMTATRHAAIDILRRGSRVAPTEVAQAPEPQAQPGTSPSDLVLAGEDGALVTEALAELPPRWRAVLWLTEVEGMAPRDAAVVLDVSPNNVAQLATRARSRLRHRYVQRHVRNHASGDCAWTVEHLGGLAAGDLTEHRLSRVTGHLDVCADCRARKAELDDLGLALRRAAGALPLLAGRFRTRGSRSTVAGWRSRSGPRAGRVLHSSSVRALSDLAASPMAHQLAAATAAGMLLLGMGTPAVRDDPRPAVAAPPRVAQPPPVNRSYLPLPPVTTTTTAVAEQVPATTPTTAAAAPEPAPAPAPAPAETPAFTPLGPLATARISTVATALGPSVAVHDAPDTPASWSLGNPRPSGAPLVFLVTAQQGDWLEVLLPVRPNGSRGWIRSDEVALSTHEFQIVVELAAHRLTAYSGIDVVLSEPIGVGTPDAPTPGGLYYTTELVEPLDRAGNLQPDGPYGPYAYGLSGFSEVIFDFGGGDGQFGIHGTNEPWKLGGDVSHGCIRMSNAGITTLAAMLPLGVPVEILA